MAKEALQILDNHKLRNTKMRRDVLNIFLMHQDALSHSDIEKQLDASDRVTLYRTLKTFEQKGIIHKAIDGGDKLKYAMCSQGCTEHHHIDEHAHFHCQKCERTFCLEDVLTPNVNIPSGYKIESAHLVLNGLCEECVN